MTVQRSVARFPAALACCAELAFGSAYAQTAPYSYTSYTVEPTKISWITCGDTGQESGCFGSGAIGPFGHICAVLEGPETMHGSTQEQRLYVTDSDAENRGKVHLLEFKKTVVTGSSKITATIVQGRFVALPLAGGGSVTCQEAANKTMIAAGTNTSTNAALIDKASLSVSAFGGFEPAETVSSIISDASGYITVNFSSGFYLLGPGGRSVSLGGGNAVIFPADNAYIP